tara:strand:- start:9733 stop:11034 length:1302 start_codon:yes stop_codon:yes gene_type:complete
MKKVLIITYYWPPMGGGGVQRWLKMTKYLREYGWEPIICTTENGEASVIDEGMLKEIPKAIETLRVPIWEPFSIYKRLTKKKKDEKLVLGMDQDSKESSFVHNLSVWVRGNLFIPDARKFWISPTSKFLINYLKENKIDAIISTGPPHSTHMIAMKVVAKTKTPWLSDFRDPWTNIDFYHKLKLTKWGDRKHKKMELQVLKKANQLVTVSWSWAKDFHRISGRMPMVITNGFDPADFTNLTDVVMDDQFTITHAGSLNEDRNPYSLWPVLKELCEEEEGFRADLQIKFIGQVALKSVEAIDKNDLNSNFNMIDHLPHEKVIKEIIKSQVLLLPLNDTPNIDGVVPGKLYEYIGAQRPILCIGKSDGDAAKILNETEAGIVCDFNDTTSLKKVVKEYYLHYKNNSLTVKSKNYEKYSRRLLAGQIAEELNKIVI